MHVLAVAKAIVCLYVTPCCPIKTTQTKDHEISTINFVKDSSIRTLVLYIYLLFHCYVNKTHFWLLGLISNHWASNTTNNIK